MLARPLVHVTVLGLLAGVLHLVRVASVPLDGDAAMYATIAKTVATTGEWLHLSFNGEPYVNKPPMLFWLNAAVFRAFGVSTWSATVVPGLFGVAGTLLVYALCRLTFGAWEPALLAGLVYLTTPEVLHWGRGVHLETLVTFWILLGLVGVYVAVQSPWGVVLGGVAAVGGWFAKGPQGLYPLLVAGPFWWWEGVLRARLGARRTWGTVAAGGLVIGLWLLGRLGEGSEFGPRYFGQQIGGVLFAGGELARGPLWYVGKLARTYWPWLPVALAGTVLCAARWRSSRGARLWLMYGAIVLLVISAAVGKKSRYLVQLYPMLAAASGVALAHARVRERIPRLVEMVLAATAVVALGVALFGGERVSARRRGFTADCLAVAARLPGDRPVWLTHRTHYGEPRLGKVIGFYARPLLRTCAADCGAEVADASALVVARAQEAGHVLATVQGSVTLETPSLVIIDTGYGDALTHPKDGD